MNRILSIGLPLTFTLVLIYFALSFNNNNSMSSWLQQITRKISQNMTKQHTTAEMVLIGDSITAWFQTDGRVHYDTHFRHLKPINFGVPGDTTEQTIKRLNGGMLGQLNSSKVTTLLIGTNDIGWGHSPEKISNQIGKIIEILRKELVGTHILLLGILPHGSRSELPGKVNRLIANYDNGKDVRFLDMTDQFTFEGKISPKLYKDQIHLSAEGYRVFAEAIQPIVLKTLEEKSIQE